MKLIKQLDEQAKTAMDQETFERLVKFATEDVLKQVGRGATDNEMLEVIHGLIENVPGFEEAPDAVELANKVLPAVKRNL